MNRDRLTAWWVYCGAHTSVSLISDGDQGECGNEFIAIDDDSESPSEWAHCTRCGAEAYIDRSPPNRVSVIRRSMTS